jgi:hypothetical protein
MARQACKCKKNILKNNFVLLGRQKSCFFDTFLQSGRHLQSMQ